jgi:hypothetical protein
MNDFDKMTTSIKNLQDNSEYTIQYNDGAVDEALFNSINWISENSLTWSQVSAEMNTL